MVETTSGLTRMKKRTRASNITAIWVGRDIGCARLGTS